MKRLDRVLLRLVALGTLVALAGCGKEDPMPSPTGGTGGGVTAGTGGGSGSGGMAMGGSGGGGGTGGGAGTGGAGGSSPDMGPVPAEYFPFKLGNRWTFNITEPGVPVYKKEQVISKMEAVGGSGPNATKMAFRLETRKYNAVDPTKLDDATISWQLREGNKVVRYRETSCTRGSATLMNDVITTCTVDVEDHWNPAKLRVDERPNGAAPAANVTWPENYTEFKSSYNHATNPPTVTMTNAPHTDTWTVLEGNTSVTVPAGTFQDCMVVQKRTTVAGMVPKTYTFCKGVGKVKEEGGVQKEELATMPTLR
jgi:hypothetical protein